MARFKKTAEREAIESFVRPQLFTSGTKDSYFAKITGVPESTLRNWRRLFRNKFPSWADADHFIRTKEIPQKREFLNETWIHINASITYYLKKFNTEDVPIGYCSPVVYLNFYGIKKAFNKFPDHPYVKDLYEKDPILLKSYHEVRKNLLAESK